jgi:hypothetical protein
VIPNASSTAIFQNGQQGYDLITAFPGAGYGLCKLNGAFDSLFFRPSILANNAESIFPAPDSGYLTSGIARGQVGFRAGAGKLSPSGFVLWQAYSSFFGFRSYGKGGVPTSDSGLIVLGVADSGGIKRKAQLMKVDAAGQVEWDRIYDEVHNGYNPVYLSHGILSLWTDMQGAHILKKHTHSGDQVWSVSVPAETDGILVGLYALSANRFVVLNSVRFPIGSRLQAVCVDSQANVIWNQTYGDLSLGLYFNSLLARKAVVTPSSELLVLAEVTWADDSLSPIYRKIQTLQKINSNGEIVWEQSYGLDQNSLEARDIRVLPDGRILAMSSGPVPNVGNQYYTLLAEFGPDSTTSIRNSPGTLALTVQPQPARDLLEVALSAESAAKAAFTLTDLQGRTLIRRTEVLTPGENRIILPVSQLAAGIYLLRAESEGKVGVKKVVVR